MSSNQFLKAKELGLPRPEVSEETRKKLSDTLKGRKLSDSHKQKISETQKKNFVNGKSRWAFDRSKKSYAEEYFENIIFKRKLRDCNSSVRVSDS